MLGKGGSQHEAVAATGYRRVTQGDQGERSERAVSKACVRPTCASISLSVQLPPVTIQGLTQPSSLVMGT